MGCGGGGTKTIRSRSGASSFSAVGAVVEVVAIVIVLGAWWEGLEEGRGGGEVGGVMKSCFGRDEEDFRHHQHRCKRVSGRPGPLARRDGPCACVGTGMEGRYVRSTWRVARRTRFLIPSCQHQHNKHSHTPFTTKLFHRQRQARLRLCHARAFIFINSNNGLLPLKQATHTRPSVCAKP